MSFVLFERQTNDISCWWGLSILPNFSESGAFAKEFLEISFLILFFSVRSSDFLSLTLKTRIFIEHSPGNKHSRLGNQLQIISHSSTTFGLVNQSNALLCVSGRSIFSSCQSLIDHPIKSQYRGLVN